jgi:hypothetical protein
MKTAVALHIAEHIWDDTLQDGSLFDDMIKMAPHFQKMKESGKVEEVKAAIDTHKIEIIARWANIIQDAENHVTGNY